MENPCLHPAIRLWEILDTPEDTAQLQGILERAADYRILVSGHAPEPHAAQDLISFKNFPVVPKERHLIGMELESQPIGYAEILRGFPVAETSVIVNFVLATDCRRKGLGRYCYNAIERQILRWDECVRIRIGVLDVNLRVLPFWEKMGFVPTGEHFAETAGSIRTGVVVLEKAIFPAR